MEGAGYVDAFTGLVGGIFNFAGGFLQAGELRKQTERKLEQMRKQASASVGQATAQAAASGFEMTSGTIQAHLQTMRTEWQKQLQQVTAAGSDAESFAMLNGVGSAFKTFAGGMSRFNQAQMASGDDPFEGMDETNPGIKTPDFDWIR